MILRTVFLITLPRSIDPVLSITDPAQKNNQSKIKLSKKQQDIRNYCSIPRNRQEILQRVGVSDHFDNRKYIYDLVEAGVLERTIPDKPNDPIRNTVENNNQPIIYFQRCSSLCRIIPYL